MKARIKATGEIIKIADYATVTLDKCDSCGNPIVVKPEDIEFIQEVTEDEHWQDVRERAAIAAMQGMLSYHGCGLNKDVCAGRAVQFANSLVEELKKEQ